MKETELKEPWLVAAWPGMGLVAHLAAGYLVGRLGARWLADVPSEDFFEVGHIGVEKGVLVPPRMPRTSLFGWRHPEGGRDLVLLLGERQPAADLRRYCYQTLKACRELGVTRVFTFAAMASVSPPSAPAHVYSAATDLSIAGRIREAGIEPMEGGEIGGLNGLFLAIAAQQGMPGACLLGEFPYFANSVPNPKAAAAVLRAFARLCKLQLDLSELDEQARIVERQLTDYVEQMEQVAAGDAAQREERRVREKASGKKSEVTAEEVLSPSDAASIEALFAEAARDRSKAQALKAELDRLGVFERFEDRFLDLFRVAE